MSTAIVVDNVVVVVIVVFISLFNASHVRNQSILISRLVSTTRRTGHGHGVS